MRAATQADEPGQRLRRRPANRPGRRRRCARAVRLTQFATAAGRRRPSAARARSTRRSPARRRTAARCPRRAERLVAGGARGRQLGQRRAGRRRASPASGPPARGRARGSSGSRAPPPWSAASEMRPVRGSKCSVSCVTASPASSSAIWRAISALMPCSRKRKEFMFLSSVLVPSSVRARRADGDVGVAAQRALLHVDVGDAELAQRLAQQLQPVARLLGRAHVGLGHDLGQRRAAAVVVHDAASEPWMRPDSPTCTSFAASSSRWMRCSARRPGARPRTAGCRTGRSGSPWPGRDRSSSCGGRSSAARSRSRTPAPIISP